MAILAHPDDESLGAGPTLARYADEGIETSLVTATLGQSGRYKDLRRGDPGHPGPERLGAIREDELRRAADVLGIRHLVLLRHMDGALDRVEPTRAVAEIAAWLRELRPDVVLTFGADGGYGHPDHIAICQFATAGIVAAAAGDTHAERAPHAVSKLYYMAWPAATGQAYESAFKKLTSTVDGVERESQPWPEWQITTILDTSRHVETTWRAIACHESQVANYEGLRDLPGHHREAIWGRQCYYRVFSTVNGGRRREQDLFEGLRGR
jgi:LmbE family N-acetylglucosaminyl deacetylase